jgi:hypothetical protein
VLITNIFIIQERKREKEINMERGMRCIQQESPAKDMSKPGHLPVQEKNCQQ